MLIVKDFEKLEKHGFKKINSLKSGDIWELILATESYSDSISLLVNPLDTIHEKNEMFIYAFSENEIDMCSRIDIVFEMLADGTVEYVKEDK